MTHRICRSPRRAPEPAARVASALRPGADCLPGPGQPVAGPRRTWRRAWPRLAVPLPRGLSSGPRRVRPWVASLWPVASASCRPPRWNQLPPGPKHEGTHVAKGASSMLSSQSGTKSLLPMCSHAVGPRLACNGPGTAIRRNSPLSKFCPTPPPNPQEEAPGRDLLPREVTRVVQSGAPPGRAPVGAPIA